MAAVRRRKGAAGTRSEAGEAGKADGRRGASSGGGREARPLRITTWTLPYPVGVTCTDMPTMWIRRRDFVGSRSSIPFLLEGVRRRRARPRPSNLGSPLVQSRPYPAPIPPRPVFVSPTCPFISCPCRRFPSPLSLPFLHVLTTAGAPRHPCPLRSPHGAVVDARTAGVFACRRRGRGGGRGECRPLWRLGALPRAVGSQGRRGGGGGTGRRGRAGPLFPHARGRGRPGGCRCRRCGCRQDGQRRKWWWRPSAEAAINGDRGARGRRAGRGVGQ